MKFFLFFAFYFISFSTFGSNGFSLLKEQEQKDIQSLMVSYNGVEILTQYQNLIRQDSEQVSASLLPTFEKNNLGWKDCLKVDQAISNAANKAQSLLSLEVLANIGLKTEYFHCNDVKKTLNWRKSFSNAYSRVKQKTPKEFINLQFSLSQTSPSSILSKETSDMIPSDVSLKCLISSMTNFRKQNISEERAREQTLNLCLVNE